MSPLPRSRLRNERGFIIVGVVMFVVALTILGLSLFGLSGFEAQFLDSSADQAQALHSAIGGIERAKHALAVLDRLPAVKLLEGTGNIEYARASYADDPDDSTSFGIDWSGSRDLDLRVRAGFGGERATVEGRFTPRRPAYRGLIESYGYVFADASRLSQTCLVGDVHVNDDLFPGWYWSPCGPDRHVGGVQQPEVLSYINQHWNTAETRPPNDNPYKLDVGAPGSITFYKTIGSSGYSVYVGDEDPKIQVRGTAVFLLDEGMRFDRRVEVEDLGGARLVLIARRINNIPGVTVDDGVAIEFYGGIHSPSVPIILISDETVSIKAQNDSTESTYANHISIFANAVELKGPEPGNIMSLSYGGLGPIVSELEAAGALPNAASNTAQFTLVPGTWREVRESNPD